MAGLGTAIAPRLAAPVFATAATASHKRTEPGAKMPIVTRIDLRDAVRIKSLYAPENALLERIGVRSFEKSPLQPTKPIALRL